MTLALEAIPTMEHEPPLPDDAKLELLDERRNGLLIRVYWLRLSNEISLVLIDEAANEAFETIVENENALDAAAHPYFYFAKAGLLNQRKHRGFDEE